MATPDTSIYANLLRPPKSVEEYDQEAQTATSNRLALMAQQAQYDAGQKAVADDRRLSGLYQNALNPDGTIDRPRLLGGVAAAGLGARIPALQKQFMEQDTAQADLKGKNTINKKTELENQAKRAELYRDQLPLITGPQQAAFWLTASYNDPEIGPYLKSPGNLEEVIAKIPRDPQAFNDWKLQASAGVTKFAEMLHQRRQQTEVERNNKAQNSVAQGNLAVAQGNLAVSHDRLAFEKEQPKGQYDADRGLLVDPRTGQAKPVVGTDGRALQPKSATKPLPTSALKMQQEELDAIGTAGSINADLGAYAKQIQEGRLQLSPVKNAAGGPINALGMSTESSRNLASFKAALERLRNESLRLNKGVQTDGDAQRAWNELIENINDPRLVSQRLAEIQKINERAANIRRMNVDQIRANFGADPLDAGARFNQPSAISSGSGSGGRRPLSDFNGN